MKAKALIIGGSGSLSGSLAKKAMTQYEIIQRL
ncbi:hypothetical protein AMURIS_00276 [Acetatifactor muris]|uniref:Uncharacterized protein n=1 Tax=Acetatifactor muris TaxID=879566 RepID=A0A2K4ZAS9_9FIRM|nr:hypothetical protein AMURIS_00276 [Acetatifactor muris]